jgi:hypothetical protein
MMPEEMICESAAALSIDEIWTHAFAALGVMGALLTALGATISFFLTRYWDSRDQALERETRAIEARDALRAKHRDVLFESLKWFEGQTQRRSIGIAVVQTSWPQFPEFQHLWAEVLGNQAIYLLSASDQGTKLHEHENLRRILAVLAENRSLLLTATETSLVETIEDKLSGALDSGLTLTPQLRSNLAAYQPRFVKRRRDGTIGA